MYKTTLSRKSIGAAFGFTLLLMFVGLSTCQHQPNTTSSLQITQIAQR